jgi:hypothetical protein
MSLPLLGSKKESSFACCLLNPDILLGLFFHLEDGGDMFLRKLGELSTDYKALYPRRQDCS